MNDRAALALVGAVALVGTLVAGLVLAPFGAALLADNVQLSPHFTLKELTVSSTATRLGLANIPGPEHLANLRRLALEVLEPARTLVGAPLRITSAYRSPEVNAALAGAGYNPSSTSDHMEGLAADFVPIGLDAREAFDRLRLHVPGMKVDQLLWYPDKGHIHIALSDSPRRMVGEHRGGGNIRWL